VNLTYPHYDYPELTQWHLQDAKLFASRRDLVTALDFLRGGVIAEVGVAFGEWSELLLSMLEPKQFIAFDLFLLHELPIMWGQPTAQLLKGMTHLEFYKQRFADRGDKVVIDVGDSHARLAAYPDKYFDMIYVDADHAYEAVRADAEIAKQKLKDEGVLIFNDYIMYDHIHQSPYGIVQVVNELVVGENWRVIGFALQPHMFCDIAIQR
jgi:hypothetical protein